VVGDAEEAIGAEGARRKVGANAKAPSFVQKAMRTVACLKFIVRSQMKRWLESILGS